MPIRNFPFLDIYKDNHPRPWLPIRIVNPHTGKHFDTFGLIDTGADECSVPAFLAYEIGHDLNKGIPNTTNTAGGMATGYAHTTKIDIFNLEGKCVHTISDIPIDFMPNLPCVLLGVNNFLDQFKLHIDYPGFNFSIIYS